MTRVKAWREMWVEMTGICVNIYKTCPGTQNLESTVAPRTTRLRNKASVVEYCMTMPHVTCVILLFDIVMTYLKISSWTIPFYQPKNNNASAPLSLNHKHSIE